MPQSLYQVESSHVSLQDIQTLYHIGLLWYLCISAYSSLSLLPFLRLCLFIIRSEKIPVMKYLASGVRKRLWKCGTESRGVGHTQRGKDVSHI